MDLQNNVVTMNEKYEEKKMEDFTQKLKRAHIQPLSSFIAEGTWREIEDRRPYEQRLREEEKEIWLLLKNTFTEYEAFENAAQKLISALAANQSVYMEMGLKAGARLLLEVIRQDE